MRIRRLAISRIVALYGKLTSQEGKYSRYTADKSLRKDQNVVQLSIVMDKLHCQVATVIYYSSLHGEVFERQQSRHQC